MMRTTSVRYAVHSAAPRFLSAWPATLLLCLAAALLGAPEARAEDPSAGGESAAVGAEESGPAADKGAPGLDSLLRPRGPALLPKRTPEPGGRDREAWERSFQELRQEIGELEASLRKARVEVGERSKGAYQYSPVGGEAPSDPEILKLRAQIRRDKKSLETAKSRLRDLQVEASLAGVPEEWTLESDPAGN